MNVSKFSKLLRLIATDVKLTENILANVVGYRVVALFTLTPRLSLSRVHHVEVVSLGRCTR